MNKKKDTNQERHCSEDVKLLYANIGKIVTTSLDSDYIFRGIMEEVRLFFNPENWSLLRLDPNSNELFFVIAAGINFSQVRDIRLKVGEGVAGKVAESGLPIFVPDTSKHKDFDSKVDERTGFSTKSIIAVPIIFQDKVYGVIEIINRGNDEFFTSDEYMILKTIADFAAIAFSNSMLYQRSLELAQTDILTGAYNRTKLNEITEHCSEREGKDRRSSGFGTYITLAAIDLDKFKEINDKYGHLDGDRVLKYLVRTLKEKVRSYDMVFRIGGDEFLVLMFSQSSTEAKNLQKRMELILQSILKEGKKRKPSISFSFGIKSGRCSNLENLLYESDVSMYDHKKAQQSDAS